MSKAAEKILKNIRATRAQLQARTPELQAALIERERIVVWFRRLADETPQLAAVLRAFAATIEDGGHLITKEP
jgi:hypothetical protein